MSHEFPHNTFRSTDAFEYVDAYRWGVKATEAEIRERLQSLNARMDDNNPLSYLLASYRGYEDALLFVTRKILPGVVKLNDLDPTYCEILTPAGYV